MRGDNDKNKKNNLNKRAKERLPKKNFSEDIKSKLSEITPNTFSQGKQANNEWRQKFNFHEIREALKRNENTLDAQNRRQKNLDQNKRDPLITESTKKMVNDLANSMNSDEIIKLRNQHLNQLENQKSPALSVTQHQEASAPTMESQEASAPTMESIDKKDLHSSTITSPGRKK